MCGCADTVYVAESFCYEASTVNHGPLCCQRFSVRVSDGWIF